MKISNRLLLNTSVFNKSLLVILITLFSVINTFGQSTLDWSTANWTPGATTGTIPFTTPVGYDPVSVTITSSLNPSDGVYFNGAQGTYPQIDYVGGEFGGIDDLGIAIDPNDNGRVNQDSPITIDLVFSAPVTGVSFTISDIDQNQNRIDRVFITSNDGDPVSITIVDPANTEIDTVTNNTIQSAITRGSSDDDDDGSAVIDFGSKVITSIQVVYTDLGNTGGTRGAGFFGGFEVRAASNIEAVNDQGNTVVEGVGGQVINNVLNNDVFQTGSPSLSDVTLTQVSSTDSGITLNTSTGAVSVSASVEAGVYVLEYQICETINPTNCDTAKVTVVVLNDADEDGVADNDDLDDDNDGILDVNEGFECASDFIDLGRTFSNNTSNPFFVTDIYSYNGVTVDASFELQGSATWNSGVSSQNNAGVSGAYVNTQPNNTGFYSGDVGVYTYTFSEPVYNVEFKFGGLDFSDVAEFNALNGSDDVPVLLTDINLGANGEFFGQTVISSASNGNAPSNAVQVSVLGPVTEISITVGKEVANSSNVTMQFYELIYCVPTDTDNDGVPDFLDLDSDNDGCFDALEGGDNILLTNLNSDGSLDGAVNSTTGVPNNVNTTNGQTVGGSKDGVPSDSNGQCDSDNDGVVDANDICNGSDDTIDIDNDNVPDGCDLDNDNDGILDTNEGYCASQILSGTWNISGSTASYDFGNGIIAEITTTNSLPLTSGSFSNGDFWSETLANSVSLESSYVWGTSITVNYVDELGNPITVTNPIIHLDRLGGTDGASTQNGAIVTLLNGLSWSQISTGTSDFNVTSNTASDSGINLPTAASGHTQESTQNDPDGTAAGSLQINGEISSFTLEFVQGGLFGTGTDGIELILSACQSVDTDDDGTPDYLDLDSDNDGCFDAFEGGDAIDSSSVDANGVLIGTVNSSTGVPSDVDVNNGQTVGSAQNDTVLDDECKVNITIGDVTVTEGDDATVTVSLDNPSSVDTVVDIVTTTGTAGTDDYTEVTTTVTIPAGDTSVDVVIPTTDDTTDEPNEDFTVDGTVTSGNTSNTDPSGTVTILDNDDAPIVSISDVTVTEGDDATVTVSL
ncbi:hypothetical protein JAO71_11880, partial [Olleya sp. YSTF-M6]